MGSSAVSNRPLKIKEVVMSVRSSRRPRCWEDIPACVIAAASGGEGMCCLRQSPTLDGMVDRSCRVMYCSSSSAMCALKSPA